MSASPVQLQHEALCLVPSVCSWICVKLNVFELKMLLQTLIRRLLNPIWYIWKALLDGVASKSFNTASTSTPFEGNKSQFTGVHSLTFLVLALTRDLYALRLDEETS
jgi:hypothetical protein